MGGRGSSSGMSTKGKRYGSEYETVLQSGNVKFVRFKDADSAKAPQETMTKGRVYATVNSADSIVAVTYYDTDGKRRKTIDLQKPHKGMLPHTHHGYEHNEYDNAKGATNLTPEEKRMVARIKRLWYNYLNR